MALIYDAATLMSQAIEYLGLGGWELNISCMKQQISECLSTADSSIGGRVTDSIGQLVFIMLYSLPF